MEYFLLPLSANGSSPKRMKDPSSVSGSLPCNVFAHHIYPSLSTHGTLPAVLATVHCYYTQHTDVKTEAAKGSSLAQDLKPWPLSHDTTMPRTNPGKDTDLGCSALRCEADDHTPSWVTGVPGGSPGHRSRGGKAGDSFQIMGWQKNHNFAQEKPGHCNLRSRLILRM